MIECLKQQTSADEMELLLLVSGATQWQLGDSIRHAFALVTVVETGTRSIDASRALGVLQASGSIVAFAEDHAFPDREWAETIIRAHQGPWTAVSPCVMNGNPQSMLSWADFLLSYGDWFATGPSREVKRALIHNGSFKRQALMQLGDSLDEYLAPSGRLVEHLTAAGHRSYIESQALVGNAAAEVGLALILSRFLTCP